MNRIRKFVDQAYILITNNFKTNKIEPKLIPVFGLWGYFTKKDQYVPSSKITSNILNQADELYEDEKYFEAYILLSSYYRTKNFEVDWRVCRALYKMTKTDKYDEQTKHAMILEAYDIINEAIKTHKNCAEVHKWLAILLDAKLQFEFRVSRIEDNIRIKNHLIEANKLNPNDFAVLYMLGQWHYKFCNLSWFQKKLTEFLYDEPPDCNYEDALIYFLKAEELNPRLYVSNIYMLGKLNYQMGNMYRAHYYLTIAAQMTPNTVQEEKYVESARNLLSRLKSYYDTD